MAIKLNFEKKIKAKPEHVYFAFTKKMGLREWLADIVEFNEGKSKSFVLTWIDGKSVFGTILEKEENERILFEGLTAEKHKKLDVEILIEEKDDHTILKSEVKGVQEKDQDKVESFFENAFDNLKSVLEDGKDLRVYKKPMLGINIGEIINPDSAKRNNYPVEYGVVIPALVEGLGAKAAGIEPGDIISEINGTKIIEFEAFSELAKAELGDITKTVVYRGEERLEIDVTLTSLPFPKIPATAHAAAEELTKIYTKLETTLDETLDNVSENAAEYRPAQGEWNTKEVLTHLLLASRDLIKWAASMVAGNEHYIGTSTMPEKLKSTIACYPTLKELRDELVKAQKEGVAFLSEISVDFTSRKNSFLRLSENTKQEKTHYEDHINQIKNNLIQAGNIK